MVRNHILSVVCPKTRAIRLVKALYYIDPTIQFVSEHKYNDVKPYIKEMTDNDLLLQFDMSKSNIPYINISNIAMYLIRNA